MFLIKFLTIDPLICIINVYNFCLIPNKTMPNLFFGTSAVAEGGDLMSEIRIKENESLDSALRRFKRQCAKAGVLSEIRKREHYEKPSVKRKKKSEAARKRSYR